MSDGRPTPYPEINALLEAVLSGVRPVLGERLLGLYLYGSLACGYFEPESSDIDFLVVTTDDLPEHLILELAELHAGLASGTNRWAKELDGDYIPQHRLRRHDRDHSEYPHLGWGGERLRVEGHGSESVIMRHTLREQGLVVAGPPPCSLIDPVAPEALRAAVCDLAREWWEPALDDPARLRDPHYLTYAILTLCRLLYTRQHGTIVSKPTAAEWAQTALEARWRPLIARAAARCTQMQDLEDTRAFLRDTLRRMR